MEGGLVSPRREGTPQGGPLSPLLSNILLDDLDKELERRGHRFVRYADDCNIYVRSQALGRACVGICRAIPSGTLAFDGQSREERGGPALEPQVPGLHVHHALPGRTEDRPAVGETLESPNADAPPARSRSKSRPRDGRASPGAGGLDRILPEVGGAASIRGTGPVDSSEAAAILWRQWKRPWTRAREMTRRGLTRERAWTSAMNGRGPWWNAGASHMNHAVPTRYLHQLGLVSLLEESQRLARSN